VSNPPVRIKHTHALLIQRSSFSSFRSKTSRHRRHVRRPPHDDPLSSIRQCPSSLPLPQSLLNNLRTRRGRPHAPQYTYLHQPFHTPLTTKHALPRRLQRSLKLRVPILIQLRRRRLQKPIRGINATNAPQSQRRLFRPSTTNSNPARTPQLANFTDLTPNTDWSPTKPTRQEFKRYQRHLSNKPNLQCRSSRTRRQSRHSQTLECDSVNITRARNGQDSEPAA